MKIRHSMMIMLGILLLIPGSILFAQVSISSDASAPDASSMLDIKSTTRGFLPPRVALTAANVAAPVPTPVATGLLVYNTSSSGTPPNALCPGVYRWNGTRWVRIGDGIVCGYGTLPDNCNPANTVTDIDGNIYATTVIGNQEWMAQNLAVTRYADGTSIPNVTDGSAWAALTSGGYCWFSNDQISFKNPYGALYNFYAAVDSRKLCPTGWHMPTEGEWNTLITLLGGTAVAGGPMKETGTVHWFIPNGGATNQYCYSAIPGGSRSYVDGTFDMMGAYGWYWSTFYEGSDIARDHQFRWSDASTTAGDDHRAEGYSVRCVKN